MAYDVFMVDGPNHVKLDTQDIDLTTIFSVADIKNISAKNDTITKTVKLKGTKTNNYAFGHIFHNNRTTSSAITNKLFFNYNPQNQVDCVVFEDGFLLLKGTIRVVGWEIKNDSVEYDVVITGKLTDLKSNIQDKNIGDVELTDLRHRYNPDIVNSSPYLHIEKYNETTSSFYTVPFQKGSGYVYPHIIYGNKFREEATNAATYNSNVNLVHIGNCRPALYVKELITRICNQAGFTFEIKGDSSFQERMNSLIIPNNEEKMIYKLSGVQEVFSVSSNQTVDQTGNQDEAGHWSRAHLIPFWSYFGPPPSVIDSYVDYFNNYRNVLVAKRSFTTDASVYLKFSTLSTGAAKSDFRVNIQLVERDIKDNENAYDGWADSVIKSEYFWLYGSTTIHDKVIAFDIPEREWKEGKQYALRIWFEQSVYNAGQWLQYQVSEANIKFTKSQSTYITADVVMSLAGPYDIITPKLPEGIKQVDFLKSFMFMFNLYAYSSKDNPKHIIFEKYDDYYALTHPSVIRSVAIDWTNKINYANGLKVKSNFSIPKSYEFKYKDDNDAVNTDYKKKFEETYGTFTFSDSLGVTDTKKVEVIYSPTPIVQFSNTNRIEPCLYSGSFGDFVGRKPTKTNIRILYYNGLKACNQFSYSTDAYASGWTTSEIWNKSEYANASTYYYENGVPVDDLNFGRPKQYYFTPDNNFINANTIYTKYFINQITELINPNLAVFECEVNLNEMDISNLDLKVPIFIDMGEFGHLYCKVIEVEYNNKSATVTLQKIFIGSES